MSTLLSLKVYRSEDIKQKLEKGKSRINRADMTKDSELKKTQRVNKSDGT